MFSVVSSRMWFQVTLCVVCLVLGSLAQGGATFKRGNDRTGRCQYSFTVESPMEHSCSAAAGVAEVEELKSRLDLLEVRMSHLTGERRPGVGQQEANSQTERDKAQLQRDKDRLERTVQDLQRDKDRLEGTVQDLQRDKHRLEGTVKDLQKTVEDMRLEVELLQGRCFSLPKPPVPDPALSFGSPGYQELKSEVTELPVSRLTQEHPENSPGCGELVSVGEPVSHRKADSIAGKYGVWMQDPEAMATYGPKMVWRIDTIGTDVRQLFGYEDMEQLSRGFPTKVVLLPEPMESTGATLYRGSLYYQRRRSRTLIRYDLATESVAARRDLAHAGFHGQYPYSWGGYTDIDFAVDEQGLWVIYSSNKAKGAIVVSQLDPNSLEVKRSWETNIRKNTVANAFMICGRLYTVASYAAPNTTINYSYDTATGQSKAMAVPFQNRYHYNSMVDYNPAHRKLYAWDNFYMVTYTVQLGKENGN